MKLVENIIKQKRYRFHPVQELINQTKWDGKPRAEKLLVTYMGADDNEYTCLTTIHFLKGVIKRVFEPGSKLDEVVVLKGKQGIAKSLFAQKLAIDSRWFSESLEKFHAKEGGEILQGKLIIELGELASMKKSSVEAVKRFISAVSDQYRPAYARTVVDNPRQCIFIGTTNEDEFLQDATGNRRFLPVECGNAEKRSRHPGDLSKSEMLQIYAEVKEKYYEPYKPLYMDDKLRALAEKAQQESTLQDSALGESLIYLNKPIPTDFKEWSKHDRKLYVNQLNGAVPEDFDFWDDVQKTEWFNLNSGGSYPSTGLILRQRVSAKELAEEGLKVDTTVLTTFQMRRFSNILKQLGWAQTGFMSTKAYFKQRAFERPK